MLEVIQKASLVEIVQNLSIKQIQLERCYAGRFVIVLYGDKWLSVLMEIVCQGKEPWKIKDILILKCSEIL